jgi:hypothetical protein
VNMSYCRFSNTLTDLRDCYDNMDEPCSEAEQAARYRLLILCRDIVGDYVDDAGIPTLPKPGKEQTP